MQALIQYPDPLSATNAKSALEGHAIYDGGYNRVRFLSVCHICRFHQDRLLIRIVTKEG